LVSLGFEPWGHLSQGGFILGQFIPGDYIPGRVRSQGALWMPSGINASRDQSQGYSSEKALIPWGIDPTGH